jgi:hypothetical protein
MTDSYSPSIRFFRNTLVFATAFAILAVMALSGRASATTPSTTAVTSKQECERHLKGRFRPSRQVLFRALPSATTERNLDTKLNVIRWLPPSITC